jgi:hypothetical protein
MNKSRSSSFRASAAASVASLVGSLVAATALATSMNPQPLSSTSGSVSVPVWGTGASNYMSPTGTGLAYCTNSSCGVGQLTLEQIASDLDGGIVEIAGTTNLNPFGADDLTFAFAVGNVSPIASVELPGFSTYSTDVQACDPNLAIPCPSTDSGGNATRDTLGDITFSATASTGLPTQTVSFLNVTDVYAIYTDAPISALIDPSGTITYTDGSTASFDALGLTPPSSTGSVPEPSALALLAAGLATLGLGMSLHRRSRR